jgi:SAM-dependent methyltransferase
MSDLSSMKDFWNKTAKKFGEDEDYRPVLTPSSKGLINWYADCLQNRALSRILKGLFGKTVLDVGCGVGRWSARLASVAALVVGLDLSREMILKAKKRMDKKGLSADFVVASTHMLPFIPRAFDAIVSVTVLQHIIEESSFKDATSSIAQTTKGDGEIILLEYSYNPSGKKNRYSSEFPTVAHCYREAFEEVSSLELIETRGVDLSVFLKPFNRFYKKRGKYKVNLETGSLSFLYKLSLDGFYFLASVACILSLPSDITLSNRFQRYSEHQVFIFKSRKTNQKSP